MREEMIKVAIAHAKAHIGKHKMNVEVYLKNPVGIGEHSDIMEAIEIEIEQMAKNHDQLEMLEKYFK